MINPNENDLTMDEPLPTPLQSGARTMVDAEGQSEFRRLLAGQAHVDDFLRPAGLEDRGDLGFDGRAVLAGLAASQPGLQFAESAASLGQGLVEAPMLGLVKRG